MNKLVFFSVLLTTAVGFILMNPLTFGICQDAYETTGTPSYQACKDTIDDHLGGPLFYGSAAVLAVATLLLFLPLRYFTAWKTFAIIYIPSAAILTALSPLSQSGGYIFSVTRSMIALLFGAGFLAISLLIFAFVYLNKKK